MSGLQGFIPPLDHVPVGVVRRQRTAELQMLFDRCFNVVRFHVPTVGERVFTCTDAWRGDVRDRLRLACSNRAWPTKFRFPDHFGIEWPFDKEDFRCFAKFWLQTLERRDRLKWNACAALDRVHSAYDAWTLDMFPEGKG